MQGLRTGKFQTLYWECEYKLWDPQKHLLTGGCKGWALMLT